MYFATVSIYFYYLHDYRRAICEAEQLLVKYQTQEEERAKALATMGMSYYMLRDFQRSRIAFENVLKKYSKHKEAVDYAEKGLLMLKALNKI
jgi:tetratricopeptide (TPR) repeat protein